MTRSAVLVALALAGCASVERAPPPARAEAQLPAGFALLNRERPATGIVADLLPTADPAFAALWQRAQAGAPTIEEAIAQVDIARAGLRAARAEQRPSVTAGATVARERLNQQQFGALPPGISIDPNRTAFDLGIDASWDLDLFGRLRANRRAAAARIDAAEADAAGVRLALRADIARAVIDARGLAAREAVARADIASAADLVSITRVRAEAGIAPGFDLVRAQSLEADARARLEPIVADQGAVLGQLVQLTATPVPDIQSALRMPTGPSLTASPTLSLPAVLLRARPDVAAAERRLAAADQDIAAAAAERYPRLSITGALGLFTLGLSNLFDDRSLNGSLGAGIAGPLLDFGRVGARIDQRQGEARAAFAAYRRALFTALGETEAALRAVAAADRRRAALARQAAVDADAAGLARERYRRGLDTFLTVVDAERTGFASRNNEIEARIAADQARVSLFRAIGGD